MLEVLTEDRINIGRVVFEEPPRMYYPLGPLSISHEEWLFIKRHLENFKDPGDVSLLLEAAYNIKTLLPYYFADLPLGAEAWETAVEELESSIKRSRTQRGFHYEYSLAMYMKLLFPERVDQLHLNTVLRDINALLSNDLHESYTITPYYEIAVELEVLFPGRMRKDNKDKLRLRLEEEVERTRHMRRWNGFIPAAASYRLLFQRQVNLNDDEWQEIKDEFERIHTTMGDPGQRQLLSLRFAYDMQVLAAQHVAITDQGIELTMPYSYIDIEQIPPLPEVRRF